MSDDKLIKSTTDIIAHNDFAEKIEEELRKRGEETAQRETEWCPAAYKFDKDNVIRCQLKLGHQGLHRRAYSSWEINCSSVSVDGVQCCYQRGHIGAHDAGEERVWTDDKPAVVADDDVGSFEVLGDMLRASPAFQQALANKLANSAPVMRQVPLQKVRQWSIDFGPEVIPAGKTVTFTYQTDMMFRGERIINTGDEDGLYLESVFIGARRQTPPGSSVAMMMFRNSTLDSGVMMDTATPGINITLIVRNAATEPRTFSAQLFGKAIL